MNKIPKDLVPSKKKNYVCPVCFYKNLKQKPYLISIYKDCSFPNYEHIKCLKCKSLFLSNSLSDKKLSFLHDKYYANCENFSFNYFQKIKRVFTSLLQILYYFYYYKNNNNSNNNNS